uniref:Tudor domain-containing protein n=1 Tax=Caenorhabditis tropicalis TaxID=1561998 RepID=A0A1I7U922_9PELO
MLTSAPVFVHPTQLPTHIPPPPIFFNACGQLVFPPGFLPPPFPAVTDEEELHELTGSVTEDSCSITDLSESICFSNFSSSSSEVSVPSPIETINLGSVTLNLFTLTGDEEEELKMYAKVQEEVKLRKQSGNSTPTTSGYGFSLPRTPTRFTSNTEIFYDTASSQDSGRATGPLTSPHDADGLVGADDDFMPMYEFEIPNSLVGLIIGVKGKTIKELSQRTNVRMLIRQHHAPEKSKTHQICQVRGKREEINHCLQMLRRRFPPARFPELNLQPVVPPVLPNSNFDMLSTQPTWLTLPEEIKCEVAVSSIISPSHFFIQQPTHPSFASLRHLDMYMGSLYGEQSNLPELPIPCQNGLLCAAPVNTSWFRAVTVQYFEETDEVFVKFVDYGGYSKMARQDLRQIRTDLMSLPFQSTEVMLAHVRPVDGTTNWSEAAMQKFRDTCIGKVINSKLVGYSVDTRIPIVELYMTVKEEGKDAREIRFDQLLMEAGLARTADPSKMSRITYSTSLTNGLSNGSGDAHMKRPSFSSQTSQTATAVC